MKPQQAGILNAVPRAAGVAAIALSSLCSVLVPAADESAVSVDYTAMAPPQLAEHLIFEAQGFRLDQETREGPTVRERLEQDELQKICSALKGATIDAQTASKVTALARPAIVYPEQGIELGDWKAGEVVARSGYGLRVGDREDEHSRTAPGGDCYACHQLDPKDIAYGTVGPSLTGYGKTRGTDQPVLKYTYDVIYQPHVHFPCSRMPRFGANGVLSQQQIADVMAYLLHPDSPVNR